MLERFMERIGNHFPITEDTVIKNEPVEKVWHTDTERVELEGIPQMVRLYRPHADLTVQVFKFANPDALHEFVRVGYDEESDTLYYFS